MKVTLKLRVAKGVDLRAGNKLDYEQIIFVKNNDGTITGPKLLKAEPRTDTRYYQSELVEFKEYLNDLKILLETERILVVENYLNKAEIRKN